MKYNIFVFFLAFAFPCNMTAAEASSTKNSPSTTFAVDQAVKDINEKINASYGHLPYSKCTLTEVNIIDIVSNIPRHCHTEQDAVICANILYSLNPLFQQCINSLTTKQELNISNVTCASLCRVEDPNSHQLIRILDRIPRLLKNFILNRAKQRINHSYNIALKGHTDTIWCFDVCTTNNMAITGSKDKTTRLWDLNNMTCTAILEGSAAFVCFHPSGSFFSTLRYYTSQQTPQDSRIQLTQWALNPRPCVTHTLTLPNINPHHISYEESDNNLYLKLIHWNTNKNGDPQYHSSLYQFVENGITNALYSMDVDVTNVPHKREDFDNHYYFVEHPMKMDFPDNTILHITKNNCHNLGLCRQAVKNADTMMFMRPQLNKSRSYQLLTDYEKRMIQAQIEEKHSQLAKQLEEKRAQLEGI